jgi:hypothetical protein
VRFKLLELIDGVWFVNGRKHNKVPLDEVAKKDPSYLNWMFNEKGEALDDEPFHALEDVMEKFHIPFGRKIKQSQSTRSSR